MSNKIDIQNAIALLHSEGYKITEPSIQPERIEVKNIRHHSYGGDLIIETGRVISEEYFPAIKQAIENVLNDTVERKPETDTIVSKPVLFTTEDGKNLTSENLHEDVWAIRKGSFELMQQYNGKSLGTWLNGWYTTCWLPNPKEKDLRVIDLIKENYMIFSTKEAAEQYILENKPCLSLNDLKNTQPTMYWLYENYIKKIVVEKINQ